jgi:mannitol/fructose-specific phosphotransferase system IIA component (Ntr-type)
VKQPVEVIAKIILPKKETSNEMITNLLMESHMIKLLENKEFVVDILEEIIEYNEEEK